MTGTKKSKKLRQSFRRKKRKEKKARSRMLAI